MGSTLGSNAWTFWLISRHVVEPRGYPVRESQKSLNTAAKFSLSPDLATGLHLEQRRPSKAARKKRELREP